MRNWPECGPNRQCRAEQHGFARVAPVLRQVLRRDRKRRLLKPEPHKTPKFVLLMASLSSSGNETACAAVTNPAKVTNPFPRPACRAPGGKAWCYQRGQWLHDPDMLAMLEAEKLARHQRLKSASCESCRAMKVRCEARGKLQSCERCLRSGTECTLAEQDGDEERPLDARPVDEILKGEKTYRREVLGEVTSEDDDDDDDDDDDQDDDEDDDEVENDDDDEDDGDSNDDDDDSDDEESGGGKKRAQRNPRRGAGFHRGQIGQSYIGVGQRARHNGGISWTPVVYYAGKQRQLHPVDSASTGTVFNCAEEAAHVRDGAVIALGSTKMILNFEDKALCTKPKWAKAREWGAAQLFEMQRAQSCPVTAKAGAGSSKGAMAKGTTCRGCAQQFKSRAALVVHERLCTPPEESDEEEEAVDGESTDDEAEKIDAAYLRKTARSGPGSSVASGQKRPYGTTCEICRIAKMRCEARGLGQPCARCMRRGTTCTLVEKEQKRAKKAATKCAKLPASKRGIVDCTVCQRTVGCSKQNRHVGRCERSGIVDAKAVHAKQRRGGEGGGASSSRGAARAGDSTAREAAGSDAGLPGDTWSCERCTLENPFAKKKCGACFAMRPGPRTSRQKVLAEQEQLVPRATSDMVGEFISFAHDKPRKRKRSADAGRAGAHTAAKRIPRPPGRSPRGKLWCHEAGAWVNAGGRKGKQAAQIKPEQGGPMATAVAEEATTENQISDGLKRPYETTCDHCRASKIRCVPRGHLKPCKRCLRRGTSCSMTDSSRIKAEPHDASEDLERSSSKGAPQVLCTRTPGCSNVDRHVGRCRNQPTAGASAASGSDGSFSTGNQSEEQSESEDDEQVPFHHDLFAHGDDGLLHMIEASDSPFGNG